MERDYSLSQLQQLTGVDISVLRTWVKADLVKPCRWERANRGMTPFFSLPAVMATAVLKTLKQRGATLTYIAPIAEFLCDRTLAEIERAAADDMVIVSAGSSLPPSFRPATEQLVNRTGFTELVFAASVRDLYQRTLDGIAYIDRQAATLN